MKKTVVTLILLLIFSGTIFFIGWIQFSVPAGKYGVLISKTGGVNPKPVIPAEFRWQWEKLIPTNTELYLFDLIPVSCSTSVNGILPSGELYSPMFEGSPDFGWKIELSVTARINPSILPELVKKLHIKDQKALEQWAETTIKTLADETGRAIISDVLQNPGEYSEIIADPSKFSDLLLQKMSAPDQHSVEIITLRAESVKVPDFSLYVLAAQTYADYQKRRSTLISQTAALEARASVSEYLQIERFARWGEVLTQYPILIDFLAVSRDDAAEAFKAVKNLR